MGLGPTLNLTQQIADHIARGIVSGHLSPQSRIQELKLAGELGVSRGSVREALLILEGRHLVEIIPRRGAVVKGLKADQAAGFSKLFCNLQVMCLEHLVLRKDIDLGDLRLALQLMNDSMRDTDTQRMIDARGRFLSAMFDLVDDYYLRCVVKDLAAVGQRMAYLVAEHPHYDMRDSVRYHQALFAALEERDESRLKELVCAFEKRQCRLAAGCENTTG